MKDVLAALAVLSAALAHAQAQPVMVTPELLANVAKSYQADWHQCVADNKTDVREGVELVLQITLLPTGTVTDAIATTYKDTGLARCFEGRGNAMRFPLTTEKGAVTFQLPFKLDAALGEASDAPPPGDAGENSPTQQSASVGGRGKPQPPPSTTTIWAGRFKDKGNASGGGVKCRFETQKDLTLMLSNDGALEWTALSWQDMTCTPASMSAPYFCWIRGLGRWEKAAGGVTRLSSKVVQRNPVPSLDALTLWDCRGVRFVTQRDTDMSGNCVRMGSVPNQEQRLIGLAQSYSCAYAEEFEGVDGAELRTNRDGTATLDVSSERVKFKMVRSLGKK